MIKCMNCGFARNEDNASACIKCAKPIQKSNTHSDFQNASFQPSAYNYTGAETVLTSNNGKVASQESDISLLSGNCPQCSYPLAHGATICPNCKYTGGQSTVVSKLDSSTVEIFLEPMNFKVEEELRYDGEDVITISKVDIDVKDDSIHAKNHLSIPWDQNRWILEKQSAKELFISVNEPIELSDGDIIMIGNEKRVKVHIKSCD